MKKYILSCCSTVDLKEEHLNKRDIKFVCFHFQLDGKSYLDDLGKTISLDTFYHKLSTGSISSTAQVNIYEYKEFFTPLLAAGYDILHIAFSSGLSGSYSAATRAQAELAEEFPDRKLLVVDSLCASAGYGLFLDHLADKRDEGMSIDELYEYALATRLNVHHWFFSTDLSFYVRGGRISKTSGLVGTILGICPLLNMNNKGLLIPRCKVRGKKHVIRRSVMKMEEHATDNLCYSGKCYISHSACYEDAKMLATLVENRFPRLKEAVLINDIGTVIGSHTGPGTVALFFFGDIRDE